MAADTLRCERREAREPDGRDGDIRCGRAEPVIDEASRLTDGCSELREQDILAWCESAQKLPDRALDGSSDGRGVRRDLSCGQRYRSRLG